MKYLSLQSSAMESSSATVTGLSVPSNNVDAVTSKMNFETWKDRQQNQLERCTACSGYFYLEIDAPVTVGNKS